MIKRKSPLKRIIICVLITAVIGAALYGANYWNLIPKDSYTADDFKIETVKSSVDYNNNGTDDYTDIMLGARIDAENKPSYDGKYYEGGYPPDDIGVCTDVIWRAFRNAGYSLRDMVDNDINKSSELYTNITKRDSNIDFRRVTNLKIFFEHHAISLTIDDADIAQWQPGDIVTYGTKHIAIVSDKRNKDGVPYIIHNGGQPIREEDALTRLGISGHYRFDTSLIDKSMLIPF